MLGGNAIAVVLIAIAFTWIHGDLSWTHDPVPWGLISLFVLVAVLRDWNHTQLTAGADWLRVNRRWVDTYDLAEIRLSGTLKGWTLHLTDRRGREVRSYIATVETNRQLWALVYNGMVHSVQNGASLNNFTTGMLRLRPDSERHRTANRPPMVPDRIAWTFLALVVAVLAATYALRPDLLGPALATFAIVVLIALVAFGIALARARARENAINAAEETDA
ncbi:hypothetical protein [Saccharopolyspora flava]|uniref:Uncharacterized protein n=1 Tax=Saccharopolyspora flava TaxID=95161 RepID=A0A1I6QTA2_9PSEU|nr:hypothetical protein [Saccharopolyspora flava]SFS55671.1 hypothetical protein SAMN05660874_01840 [Saccharopolyspora flava]